MNIAKVMDMAVPAGFVSTFLDSHGTNLDLNDLCVKHPASTFFVKVDGFSMINAGITDGDMLVVDRSLIPSNNSIVVALYNGGFTVKKLLKQGEKVYLIPENPKFKPIKITDIDDFEIWGVVTFVIKRV